MSATTADSSSSSSSAPTGATAAAMVERKKRTRPVSACEQCRSKKVKCFLLPDQPVCKGCAQSGKQCLFRIDDLSPALRRERFAEYDRQLQADKQLQRQHEQHEADSAAKRKRRKRQESSEPVVGVEDDEEEDTKVKRDKDGKPIKTKAVFRCFANPTKLAAPSVSRPAASSDLSSTAPIVLRQKPEPSTTSSPSSALFHQPSTEDGAFRSRRPYPTQQQQPFHDNTAGYSASNVHADAPSYASNDMEMHYSGAPYSNARYNGTEHQQPMYPQQQYQYQYHHQQHPQQQQQQHPQQHPPFTAAPPPPLPPFRSSYSSSSVPPPPPSVAYGERMAAPTRHDYVQPLSPRDYAVARQMPSTSRDGSAGTWRPIAHRGNPGPPAPRTNGVASSPNPFAWSPSDHNSTHSNMTATSGHGGGDSSSRTTGSVSNTLDRAWPPPEQAAHQTSDAASLPASIESNRKAHRDSTSSYDGQLPLAAPASPTVERNDLAAASQLHEDDNEDRGAVAAPSLKRRRKSGAVGFSGSAGGRPGSSAMEAQGSSHVSGNDSNASPYSSSTASRQPVTFKKIALPFFRWFGATANTPGIRRIKVGVYHESDMDFGPNDEAGGEPTADNAAQSPAADHGREVGGDVDTSKKSSGEQPHVSASPSTLNAAGRLALAKSPNNDQRSPIAAASGHGSPSVQATQQQPIRTHTPFAESALSTTVRELFESNRPRYPRRDVLLHLVPLFLKYFKASCFPWLDNADLIASAESGELPAILANAICAMTARFGSHPDLLRAKNASESFADMTKVLIVPMLSWPSIDVIETLVILSYAEFGAGADAGLWMYVGMALRMATDLGLQHELTIRSMATSKQQDRARYLFWAIVSLDRITCFGTGRPVTVRDDAYDCELPPLVHDTTADGFVFGHIVRTLLKRGRIGELLNRRDDGLTLEQRGAQLRALWLDLAEFYESLPPDLHFGVNTFRKLAAADKGCAFVYLHILLQSTISLLNRPSLLRRFDRDFSIAAPSRLASIAGHASGTIVSILRFAADAGQHRARSSDENADVNPYIDCNPYLDQLILPAGRAFLSEREAAKETLRSFGHPASQSRPLTANAAEKEGGDDDNKDDTGKRDADPAATVPPATQPQELSSFSSELFQGLHTRRQYAQTNIATCQEVLDRVARWWAGASWPARALRQESEGAVDGDVGPDGTDEEAQPAPIRDVEMVLRWARARRIRANRITPPSPSRRGSVVSLGQGGGSGGDDDGGAALTGYVVSSAAGGEQNLAAGQAHVVAAAGYDASLADELNGGGGGAWNGTSPLGLGFSGSFGAGAEVDVDALISAWARELGTIESTAAVQGGGGGGRGEYTPAATPSAMRSALTTRSRPASRAHRRANSSSIGAGGRSGMDHSGSALPEHHHHHHQQQQQQHEYLHPPTGGINGIDIHGWALGSSGPMDIDLSEMQLEEFFFEPPAIEQPHDGGDAKHDPSIVMAPAVGPSSMFGNGAQQQQQQQGGSSAYSHNQPLPPPQQQHHAINMPPPSNVLSNSTLPSDSTGIVLHQDLDMLPTALLNTFNFHLGAQPRSAALVTSNGHGGSGGFDSHQQHHHHHSQSLSSATSSSPAKRR